MRGRSQTVTLAAPAKINLWLRVVGRRADGYHRLDTVFQGLELADRVTVTCRPATAGAGSGVALAVSGNAVPAGPENLCARAARAYLERWPAAVSVAIGLDKRIPVAAGLGGGSSDAATVLLALRTLLAQPREVDELVEPARRLGADVPFFLVGGTARGRERGDAIEPLPDLEPATLWLVAPLAELPTAAVFADYARRNAGAPDRSGDEMSLPAERSIERWILGNDLETSARSLCPQVEAIYTVLQRFGFGSVQLSGSGGVVFGIPPEGVQLDAVARDLDGTGEIHVTRTRVRRAIGSS